MNNYKISLLFNAFLCVLLLIGIGYYMFSSNKEPITEPTKAQNTKLVTKATKPKNNKLVIKCIESSAAKEAFLYFISKFDLPQQTCNCVPLSNRFDKWIEFVYFDARKRKYEAEFAQNGEFYELEETIPTSELENENEIPKDVIKSLKREYKGQILEKIEKDTGKDGSITFEFDLCQCTQNNKKEKDFEVTYNLKGEKVKNKYEDENSGEPCNCNDKNSRIL